MRHVLRTVTRAREGVVLTPGITVIGPPGAAAAAVMPGVRRTPGLPRGRDARGHARGVNEALTFFTRRKVVRLVARAMDMDHDDMGEIPSGMSSSVFRGWSALISRF